MFLIILKLKEIGNIASYFSDILKPSWKTIGSEIFHLVDLFGETGYWTASPNPNSETVMGLNIRVNHKASLAVTRP